MKKSKHINIEQITLDKINATWDDNIKRRHDLKNVRFDWTFLHVTYTPVKYIKQSAPQLPTSNVLYTAYISNKCPEEKHFCVRTKRTTISTCVLTYGDYLSYNNEISAPNEPPGGDIISAAFKTEKTQKQGNKVISEQEMTWAIDTTVAIPPYNWSKVDMTILEESFNGRFETTATFEGMVQAWVKKTKDRKRYHFTSKGMIEERPLLPVEDGGETPVEFSVEELLTPDLGFTLVKKKPTFLIKGECKCRYGVEQEVVVTEFDSPFLMSGKCDVEITRF
ncbi:uncharacterized protein LOC131940574 [Physella acuta]|uniref:uncharacterized protein LOC131940574 n=1 Tax=Physella acuta TaxID=109671 RepID=UPI0027DB84BA|nr:uncharacterized protein LOC131940574 [Physella acuta]